MSQVAHTVDYEEGELIIRKGEVGHTFFIVLDGVVHCSDTSFVEAESPSSNAQDQLQSIDSPNDHHQLDGGSRSLSSSKQSLRSSSRVSERVESETKESEMKATTAVGVMQRKNSLPKGGVRLKSGEWFGEIALLTGSVRTANVVADSSVRLLAFDRDAFEKALGSLKDILDRKANNRMLSDLPIIARLPPKKVYSCAVYFFNLFFIVVPASL
jgi:CRP-like cAMP-binding protein